MLEPLQWNPVDLESVAQPGLGDPREDALQPPPAPRLRRPERAVQRVLEVVRTVSPAERGQTRVGFEARDGKGCDHRADVRVHDVVHVQ